MAEKVTKMVLKVDLQCPRCYKKIKKMLCQIPQIQDSVFDEKANTVTIIVTCCSPEKIRQKLCCKGGKTIKTIDIMEPAPPPAKPVAPGWEKPKAPPPFGAFPNPSYDPDTVRGSPVEVKEKARCCGWC